MTQHFDAIVVGGGPAGLMAAQQLLDAGVSRVALFDSQRSVGRKFLLAGIGGLNLTHSSMRPSFDEAFGAQSAWVAEWLDVFDNDALIAWANKLGADTFVGTSGRVFPSGKKAAPLLRSWLSSLRAQGLQIFTQHKLKSLDGLSLNFSTPVGDVVKSARTVVLALGGGSWPQLGSDGSWQQWFDDDTVAPLVAANCGFEVDWSPQMQTHAGAPLKPVIIKWHDAAGVLHERQGECVISHYGLEGSAIYPTGPDLRAAIASRGVAVVLFDLMPHWSVDRIASVLLSRGSRSLSEIARKQLNLSGGRLALFNEVHRLSPLPPAELALTIKNTPVSLRRPRPIAEAISSAGGVRRSALSSSLMLQSHPGIFVAGEMLDWEAPTGGYLLTACFASGVVAGRGASDYLSQINQ